MKFVELLYGSRARGDFDHLSDVDLLSVRDVDECDYSWREIEFMHEYGSLFLHHLKLEGRIVAGTDSGRLRWFELMQSLPPYGRIASDLATFSKVIGDVFEAVSRADSSVAYEASVMARLVRHLAILACYAAGAPNFTRYRSVEQASEDFQVPIPCGLHFADLYTSLLDPEGYRQGVKGILDWGNFALDLILAVEKMEEMNGKP